MKRSGKFYYSNEKKTLKALDLEPVPGSGSGWIQKEDGENEVALVQLKSTDSSSYRINMLDIKKLEYHAQESHKVPIFLIQFLQQNKIYALVDINNIEELSDALKFGKKPKVIKIIQSEEEVEIKKIKSSAKSREKFYKEKEEMNGKRKRN